MRVRLHPSARREFHEAAEWYATHAGPRVASAFITAYEAVRSKIVEHPRIGSPGAAGTRRLVFPNFPYLLIYRLQQEEIVVIAVAHQRREPSYWTKRR
jgi:plasmid stabilization system protein ParE